MELLIHFAGLLTLLVLIVWVCIIFTNAVEHLGKALNLGHGAVGSIFAAVGTAMPETIVPLVAIFGAYLIGDTSGVGHEIGVGAILGAPFLLSTLAMFLVGLSVFIFNKMKIRENKINADPKHVLRDFKYFFVSYSLAILAGFIHNVYAKWVIAASLLLYYCLYVYTTIVKSKEDFDEGEELEELWLCKILKMQEPCGIAIGIQVLFSLIGLIFFAHLFVGEIKFFSTALQINPLILSLIIVPIATELPEKANSILWIKHKKDTLALGNITGAMVFQSAIPTAIGILLTPWVFEVNSIANIVTVYLATLTVCIFALILKKISPWALLTGGVFYLAFIGFVVKNLIS